jgi:cutinase
VLGGYSQGAAVMDIITSVPFPAIGFTNPLPPDAPNRVAAVAVFGNPTTKIGLPMTSSPVYGTRAIDLCNAGDPVCSDGNDVPAHRSYGPDGLTSQAAAFVARLL